MEISTLDSAELSRLAQEYHESEPLGTIEGRAVRPGEITIVKTTTRAATLEHSLAEARTLAAVHPVLYINRLTSGSEIARAINRGGSEAIPAQIYLRNYCTTEITADKAAISAEIASKQIKVVIVSTFESVVETERHRKELVMMIRSYAFELGCAVIIYTQDNRTKITAGEFSRGALGALANLASEIIDPAREQASKPPPPKPKPAVEWWPKEQLMTYQQRTGMKLAEKVKPRDLQMVLRAIKETRADLLAGKIKLKRVSEEEEKAIIEKFLPANELEIKDLEARVYQDAEEAARREALGMNTEEYKMRWGS